MADQEIKVVSVNISEKKGTIKMPVPSIQLSDIGVIGDAHSGHWHRQVSLLAEESIGKFSGSAGRKINYGEFAENITTRGIEVHLTHPLDRFSIGEVELEVTQIGKKCHGESCNIFKEVGNCVMPKEGIFCRVLKPGNIKAGDQINYNPRIFRILIITLSDRASAGEYEDRSGPVISERVQSYFDSIKWKCAINRQLIPDDADLLRELLLQAKLNHTDLVFTTGGTGIGPRDFTPDVVKPLLDKEIPGIMELIRFKYGQEKPNALLTRAVAGVMGNSLVYTLPGSVKAVEEYTTEIFSTLKHSVFMLNGLDLH
ncbi:MAG TPA: molybdenum cofactor synthesis domain-containing protein [Bacteroidales bacterium]